MSTIQSVLVIGENPEEQLQKYHNFRCTGIDDQYITEVDVTKEALELVKYRGIYQTLKCYQLYNKVLNRYAVIEDEQDIDIKNKHKYGYALVQDEKLVKLVIRTNPNKKWRWYNPDCNFLLKNGAIVSKALKKDIDFKTVINNTCLEAEKEYDKFQTFLSSNNLEFPKTWEECKAEFNTYEKADKFYYKQKAVKKFKKCYYAYEFSDLIQGSYLFNEDPFEYFGKSKEDFIEHLKYQNVLTYAVLKDFEWFSSCDPIKWEGFENKKWIDKFWELVNTVPDDTLFSLYVYSS